MPADVDAVYLKRFSSRRCLLGDGDDFFVMGRSADSPHFHWDKYNATAMGRYLDRRELTFVRRYLGALGDGPRVLDCACGSGRITISLLDAGCQVVGIDAAPQSLAAFQRAAVHAPVVQGAAEQLPFRAGSFDGVVAIQAVGVIDLPDLARASHAVLAPRGLLLFDVVNRRSYKRLLTRVTGQYRHAGPGYEWTLPAISRALGAYGFELLEARGYNWPPFGRRSDRRLVSVAASLESLLQLHRLTGVSPWLLCAARKSRAPR